MDKIYNPQSIETHWYPLWESRGYFKPRGAGPVFSIIIPPPNVTGTLHMGHGFQHTLMDVLVRYHRMRGYDTLWQVGVDHAGIATQMVVERQLAADNITRHQLGRTAFVEKIWEWKTVSGNTIQRQMRRLGSSVDWSRDRFTMDDDYSDAVLSAFIRLYEDGLIYRGKRLVNWDPVFLTAISDLEVENETQQGQLWYIRYPLVDRDGALIVATTRPETLFGDTAVAVHPDDSRYQHLIGQSIKLPLTDRSIPIIADHHVDPSFGSGCVKITPAHDFNDYAVGMRHQLPLINVLTPDAKLNEHAAPAYHGLDRFIARKKIVQDLQQQGLIEKIIPHTLTIPRGDRSGAVIEPYLTDQWYVRVSALAEQALRAAVTDAPIPPDSAQFHFVPDHWKNTYDQWLTHINDWCISRQLWWGHRVPVWYDADHRHYVGKTEAEVRQKYQLSPDITLRQDEDVLDTWFSSAIWPLATLGWPKPLERFYPTSVLITGFDIIFFWVARMVMMGLYLDPQQRVPFYCVYMTGLIRDHEGKKMSKTKGNVLDPLDLIDGIDLPSLIAKRVQGLMQPQMKATIEKNTRAQFPAGIPAFGTDAVRFTFCALATPGRDIRFDNKRLEGYRNFCNKLWNAARFVILNTEGQTLDTTTSKQLIDQWILERFNQTVHKVTQHISDYRFDLLAQCLYEFVWNDYCDWYVEFVKPTLHEHNPQTPQTRYTLIHILEMTLRLLHPIMPFITEEIWQKIAPMLQINRPTIMLEAIPAAQPVTFTADDQSIITTLQQIITEVRQWRSQAHIAPSKKIPQLFFASQHAHDPLNPINNRHYQPLIQSLAKIDIIQARDFDTLSNNCAVLHPTAKLELRIPLDNLLDKGAEKARLLKEQAKLYKDQERSETKLNNEDYRRKAPPHVVAAEELSLREIKSLLQKVADELKKQI